MRTTAVVALSVLAAIGAGAGCAKAKAETIADGLPLAVPAPPLRVLVAPDDPLPATASATLPTLPPEAPLATPPDVPVLPPARPPARRSPTETDVLRPPEPPARPAGELRPATQADGVDDRRARDFLMRAARDWARVDPRKLSPEGRSQFEQSKRFADQAEAAIRDRNLVYALTLAEKAATLAAELVGL